MECKQLHTAQSGNLIAYADSHIGGRKENQDSYGAANTEYGFLVTVCDGMGGGPGGATASSIAVQEIIAGMMELKKETPENAIKKSILRANLAIIQKAQEYPELFGMGSTATVLLLTDEYALVAHVGDSRVYQIRGKHKVYRTFDHSKVFQMVRDGIITEEQARLSAESNIITRALGITRELVVELSHPIPYCKGDRFVLTTDGIHGTMPEEKLIKYFGTRKYKLPVLVSNITAIVNGIGHTQGGGHDNLTIAMVEVFNNSKIHPKMSMQMKITMGIVALLLIACAIFNTIQVNKLKSVIRANEEKIDSLELVYRHNIDSINDELNNSKKNDTIVENKNTKK